MLPFPARRQRLVVFPGRSWPHAGVRTRLECAIRSLSGYPFESGPENQYEFPAGAEPKCKQDRRPTPVWQSSCHV